MSDANCYAVFHHAHVRSCGCSAKGLCQGVQQLGACWAVVWVGLSGGDRGGEIGERGGEPLRTAYGLPPRSATEPTSCPYSHGRGGVPRSVLRSNGGGRLVSSAPDIVECGEDSGEVVGEALAELSFLLLARFFDRLERFFSSRFRADSPLLASCCLTTTSATTLWSRAMRCMTSSSAMMSRSPSLFPGG